MGRVTERKNREDGGHTNQQRFNRQAERRQPAPESGHAGVTHSQYQIRRSFPRPVLPVGAGKAGTVLHVPSCGHKLLPP